MIFWKLIKIYERKLHQYLSLISEIYNAASAEGTQREGDVVFIIRREFFISRNTINFINTLPYEKYNKKSKNYFLLGRKV